MSEDVREATRMHRINVYVELQHGADPAVVAEAIRSDPLHIGVETLVLQGWRKKAMAW